MPATSKIPFRTYELHEWNATRFRVLGRIRQESLRRAIHHGCDFYFTADVDNFIRPNTLRELVALQLPIVGPFLRSVERGSYYSNYHAAVDDQGYYSHCDQYDWVLNRWITGVVEMPVVHCTYLVRTDVIPLLNYQDGTDRHEYVIFSDSARRAMSYSTSIIVRSTATWRAMTYEAIPNRRASC